jgi:hypothetical protein
MFIFKKFFDCKKSSNHNSPSVSENSEPELPTAIPLEKTAIPTRYLRNDHSSVGSGPQIKPLTILSILQNDYKSTSKRVAPKESSQTAYVAIPINSIKQW